VRGRLAPFIELGVGFNPDLTARDNVLVNAVMLGLTPAQARERYDSVIAFAELEEFQDLKLKNYSSGMHVRLAFSVMVHVDADLMLIDEVLAVGDAAFQAKCRDVLDDARRRGTTILLVTHDMSQIRRFCDRALLLDHGTQVAVGPAPDVARSYTQLNFAGSASEGSTLPQLDGGPVRGGAAIVDAWAQTPTAGRTEAVEHGTELNLCVRVRFAEAITRPRFAFTVTDEDERVVFVASTEWAGTETGAYEAGEEVDAVVAMDNWLAAGRFVLSAHVLTEDGDVLAHRRELAVFASTGSPSIGAAVDPPYSFHFFADRLSR
jgi:energy-coupling factor transporter ATP-binding protein EcfA2